MRTMVVRKQTDQLVGCQQKGLSEYLNEYSPQLYVHTLVHQHVL